MKLRDLEKGLRVNRAHTEDLIHEEKIGQHSAHVGIILLWVYFPSVPSDWLLANALLHDIPEGYTGDCPANIKVNHPYMAEAYRDLEGDWWDEKGWPDPHYMLSTEEEHMLKLADMVSLARKCQHEISMGNIQVTEMFENICSYIAEFRKGMAVDSQHRAKVDELLEMIGVRK